MNVLVLGPVGVGPVAPPESLLTPTSNILRAVLAALALAGTAGLSAGELFETVWGSRDARSMDSTLTVSIHRLRRWLRSATRGQVSVTRTTSGYALGVPDGEVDAFRFLRLVDAAEPLAGTAKAEALGEALALWRGPALADIPDGSADQDTVMRLELRRVTATVDYARALLTIDQGEQAVQVLSSLVMDHALDERVIGAWIEALAATGRQADALDAYERLRLRLRDEMGADPGRALSQALTRVLRQEVTPSEAEEPKEQPAPRRDILIPAQLPADTYVFTGRTDALARLDALRRDASSAGAPYRIVTLTGAGGVGKTALAVHWAHRAAASFPGGQIYANLHGFSASPPERPIDVLGRFLRALGVNGSSVPVDLDEAGALYRSLLVNRRVLIVLDNAVNAAQVRPLLPGAETCRVLVTSRDRLDGLVALDGAYPIGLDVLPERECVELLARVLGESRTGAEPDATLSLVRACAALPLALRIAAAQLVIHPDRSIAQFVAQLADGVRLDSLAIGDDELSQVRAVFDLSYARLDPLAGRLFRMIGAIPEVDLTVDSVAALLGGDVRQAEAALDGLAGAHLISAHLPGRYDCHDLLREYATERARAEDTGQEREATLSRLADWYEAGVVKAVDAVYLDRDRLPAPPQAQQRAAALFTTLFAESADALGWLRAEHRNILAVIEHTADHGALPSSWRMAWALRPHFKTSELHMDWFTAVAAAERALADRADSLGLAALNLLFGDVAQLRSEAGAGKGRLKRAYEAAREAGWPQGAAAAQMQLGLGHFDEGDLETAKGCFTQAAEQYRASGSKYGESRATANLGLVYCDTGPLRTAVELLARADTTRLESGYVGARAHSLCSLGYANWRAGDFAEARRLLDQSLELAESNGDTRAARLAHCDLVALDCSVGDFAQARYHATLAESLGAQAGTPRPLTQTNFAWGLVYEGERDYVRAQELYDEVLRQALQFGDSNHEICALIGGASVCRALGALPESLRRAQRALALSHDRGVRLYEADALVELAETNLALGNVDRACRHAERAVALGAEIGYQHTHAKAMRALGDALRQAEGEQAALPHWRAAHDLFVKLGSPQARELLARGY